MKKTDYMLLVKNSNLRLVKFSDKYEFLLQLNEFYNRRNSFLNLSVIKDYFDISNYRMTNGSGVRKVFRNMGATSEFQVAVG